MSGLFSSPFPSSATFREAIVTNVDPIRFICTVRTSTGQTFPNTTWLLPAGGSGADAVHLAPNVFDKVLVCMSTASPIIVGCIPRLGTPDLNPVSTSGAPLGIDHGNSTNLKNGFTLNPNKPTDFHPGDKVFTSRGGGFISLLTSGGILLKSSNLAQVFISKFNGLVRIVARNFYRFSDASSEMAVSVKGALYTWFGADWDLLKNTTNTERYNEVVGHVAAGKLMRGEPSSNVTIPDRDSRVREHWLKDATGNEIMIETMYEDGKLVLIVRQPDVASTTTVTHDDAMWESKVVKVKTSTVTVLPDSISINHNNVSTALLDSTHVNVNFNNVSTVNLNATGVQAEAHGHFMRVDASGTHLG